MIDKWNWENRTPAEQIEENRINIENNVENIASTNISISNLETKKANKIDVYTKSEVDNLISNVDVDLSNYYTKNEIDGEFGEVDNELNLLKTDLVDKTNTLENQKADKIDTYNKTEVNTLIENIDVASGELPQFIYNGGVSLNEFLKNIVLNINQKFFFIKANTTILKPRWEADYNALVERLNEKEFLIQTNSHLLKINIDDDGVFDETPFVNTSEISSLSINKADKSQTYTKLEVDTLINNVDVDLSNYYTKKEGNISNIGALDLKDRKLDNTIVNLAQGQSGTISDSPTNLFPSTILNLQNSLDTVNNFFGYQLAVGSKNEPGNEQGRIYLRRISSTGGLQSTATREFSNWFEFLNKNEIEKIISSNEGVNRYNYTIPETTVTDGSTFDLTPTVIGTKTDLNWFTLDTSNRLFKTTNTSQKNFIIRIAMRTGIGTDRDYQLKVVRGDGSVVETLTADILRSTRTDEYKGISLYTFTSGATDPYNIVGFKIELYNNSGSTLTLPAHDIKIDIFGTK